MLLHPHFTLRQQTLLILAVLCFVFNLCANAASAQTRAKQEVHRQTDKARCDCELPWREYTKSPTPEIKKLWLAANQGDEVDFAAGLIKINDINEYAVAGQPILHALLSPVASTLSNKVYWDMSPEETKAITALHRASWAAKERMLELALKHKISWKDVTYQSRMPALHLAAAYGSPRMVKLLLDAGADADQINYDKGRRLLTALLEGDEFAQRMSHLPLKLQTAEERNLILQHIIKAAKQEPFSELFEPANPDDPNSLSPAYWRYSMWKGLILDPDIETKTLVAFNEKGWGPVALTSDKGLYNPLRDAAAVPNPTRLVTIQTFLPRFFTDPSNGKLHDLWLDAACQAAYNQPAAVFTLVDAQSSWTQTNAEAGYAGQSNGFIENNDDNQGMSLAEHIVFAGQGWLLEALTTLHSSAAVNQDRWVSLAFQARHTKLALELLQKGYAAPVLNLEQRDSPYYQALISAIRNNELLLSDYLLSHLTPEVRSKLIQADDNLLNHLGRSIEPVEGQEKSAPPDVLPMAKMLVTAGANPKSMDSSTLFQLLYNEQAPTVIWLLEQGAPVEAEQLINAAIKYRQNAVLPSLFKTAAAQPLLSGEHGRQWLIQAYQQADSATITFLEQAGVNLSASEKLQAAAYRGDSDWLREVHAKSGGSLETYCLYAYQLDLNQLLGRDDLLLALEAIGVKRIAFCEDEDDTATLPTLLTLQMLSSETFNPVFNPQERYIISKRLQKILALNHNAVDSSALQQAVLAEREDILNILLEAGIRDGSVESNPATPNTNVMPAKGKSALAEAIDIRAVTSAKLLLQYGQTLRTTEQAHYACAPDNHIFAAIGLKLPACVEPNRSLQKKLLGTWKLNSENGKVAILKLDDQSAFSLSQYIDKSLYSQYKGKWQIQDEQVALTISEKTSTSKVNAISIPSPDRGLFIEFGNSRHEISQPPKIAVYDGQSTQSVSMNTTENNLELKGKIQGLAFWNGERWSVLPLSPELASIDQGTLRIEYEEVEVEKNRQILLQIGSGKNVVLRMNNQEFNRANLK